MEFLSEASERGVVERSFRLTVEGDVVPGVLWTPDGQRGQRPTVLLGHGGTQHKRVANILALARSLVRHLGYAAVALDAPGHGDRVTDPEAADRTRRELQGRIVAARRGQRRPLTFTDERAAEWTERTRKGSAEWSALLDALGDLPDLAAGPFGYWGVSMGTVIGLPFVAAEPRVRAAVLGLAGLTGRPGAEEFEQSARSLSCPVLFTLQWDDELVERESGVALFDAIGSREKTLHVNPGGHIELPLFERAAAEAFFSRHLHDAS